MVEYGRKDCTRQLKRQRRNCREEELGEEKGQKGRLERRYTCSELTIDSKFDNSMDI